MRVTGAVALIKEAAIAANEARTPKQAIQDVLWSVCRNLGWSAGHAHFPAPDSADQLRSSELWYVADPRLTEDFRIFANRLDDSVSRLAHRVFLNQAPDTVQVGASHHPMSSLATDLGVATAIAFPITSSSTTLAVLEFFAPDPLDLRPALNETLRQVSRQISRVFEREADIETLRRSEQRYKDLLEQALREKDRKYQNIFDSVQVGLIRSRITDGKILEANTHAAQILGYESKEDFIENCFLSAHITLRERIGNAS